MGIEQISWSIGIYFYLGESGGKLEYLNFDEILKFLQNEIYILELELLELNN